MPSEPSQCETCGVALSETEPTSPCTPCRSRALLTALPTDVLARVDRAILAQHPLEAVMYLRAHGKTLAVYEALDAVHVRYAQLRESRPAEFTCPHETYWDEKGL